MKRSIIFSVAVLLTAFSLLISCAKKCDKNDPNSDCYVSDPATTDAGVVINGIKWATCNVDAPGTFAATPESAGMFYKWNSRIGWSSTDPIVSTYGTTIWDGSKSTGTSWTSSNDPCPTGWRVPTNGELQSLAASNIIWNVNGRIFGSGNNTIFLPAAGFRLYTNGSLGSVGANGYYWSSSVNGDAYLLHFNSSTVIPGNVTSRGSGFSVRCVAK